MGSNEPTNSSILWFIMSWAVSYNYMSYAYGSLQLGHLLYVLTMVFDTFTYNIWVQYITGVSLLVMNILLSMSVDSLSR